MLRKLSLAGVGLLSSLMVVSPVTALAASHRSGNAVGSASHYGGKPVSWGGPNMFAQTGYSQTAIHQKIKAAWNQLFHGNKNTQTVYYQMTPTMAYIEDIGNADVRTEGMGYGMMIAVELGHKKAFDSLWNYAKTYMQHKSGPEKYYFSWHTKPNGTVLDTGVAPDGDQWITAALLFASARFGNGGGIYNYKHQARLILHAMWHDSAIGGVNMFSHKYYLPTFSPPGSVGFTDPSYALPAFYRVFAAADPADRVLWDKAYFASQRLLQNAANPKTGLAPDYSTFTGKPYAPSWGPQHKYFEFDAWRAIANANVDAAWFGPKPWEVRYSNTIEKFFNSQGINSYGNNYALNGTELSTSSGHSTGLVAMNASSAIAARQPLKYEFVKSLWNQSIPSGHWRYYDGMLYMLGLLYDSGEFKVWWPTPERHFWFRGYNTWYNDSFGERKAAGFMKGSM
ncbi:glycosyl hydrolase family 8 [Alicyclobacillus sp. SO9]|uniref:glycosyl hydrolase family 8 n=1 Tax=Alicyclobacillus sp. SO9 TaxID=2665646 RepID=UPI0018E707CE|nr:glycosyl hydrolase family 8 [Alicyclobacillus sp. SO9]QQE77891.1 xylanase [Alicyclobacillus sp. SO9]